MKLSHRAAGLAAAALLSAGVPASAQQYSEGYKFLEAVRKAEGNDVNRILNEPGQTIINTRDRSSGDGALHIVVRRSDPTYLRFLLQKGANPNMGDARGNTPMMLAVDAGFLDGIDILRRYKANVNQANASGETPLIRAVQLRNYEMVRDLLAAGADPDHTDVIAGLSARDYARRDGRSPAISKALADAPKRGAAPSRAAGPKF
ncbi:ankyrin repeat domain-containing protein [Sphingomonas baiyangensis]|uniref:Ankyrin repeat domain-containing protein n=1 Tax=Sphingomonas baiyangensis TaxID=2572576 RepID=A0A4U1L5S4_9SPHN|nr:ankyrin repeat domain-containing protein [Sphingomonas baiyangensis]TKD51914.1 ankyrin repeat domain-containing protein [Sphingomonas baiyangensis]